MRGAAGRAQPAHSAAERNSRRAQRNDTPRSVLLLLLEQVIEALLERIAERLLDHVVDELLPDREARLRDRAADLDRHERLAVDHAARLVELGADLRAQDLERDLRAEQQAAVD